MSDLKRENELMAKAARWGIKAAEQVMQAGGSPVHVLRMLPDELLTTMVRNRMEIVCVER